MSGFSPTSMIMATMGIVLVAAGIFTVRSESSAYLAGGPGSVQRVASWVQTDVAPGLSTRTIKLTLLDCANVLNAPESLEMRYQDDAIRAEMPATCREIADKVTLDEPTFSYGWYVGALASAAMQDWAAMNDHLVRSRAAGPTQAWVTIQRVLFAEGNYDQLAPAGRAANDLDLSFLVSNGYGLDQLAELYFAETDFRHRITAIVETLPALEQRRFIGAVRAASQAGTAP